MLNKNVKILIYILTLSISYSRADLPVHCPLLENQTVWKLHVSSQNEKVNLF